MSLSKEEKQNGISEYLTALNNSTKFGPQVVCHKSFPAIHSRIPEKRLSFSENIRECLLDAGVEKLYSHQQESYTCLGNKENVIVATPTASGKSMIYNIPLLEELEKNPRTHALYLFPLKALAQDQLKTLEQLASAPFFKERYQEMGAIYDGDTSPYRRRKIRDQPPPVLMTNPDMLHLSLLPYHDRWAHFFRYLKFIVIDEVHTYRGIFGSHMAWVIARLQRIVEKYGATPRYILLSATIGNPRELGETLLQRPVTMIDKTGASQSKKHILFLNPWDSAAYTASQLLEAALKRGLRTIVYTQSRKMTELITMWTRPRLGNMAERLSSYRAGFLPEERREVEKKLNEGVLLGVISTSALELGIDIGDLDLCILVGYPGSIMATWQRGGRVGRGEKESAVILIAQEDALDQYFMRNPDDFFQRDVESAVLNPENETISEQHLHCAAAEIPLSIEETLLTRLSVRDAVERLSQKAILLQAASGKEWFASRKIPQRHVHLRGSGTQMTIINGQDGVIMGEIDASRALKECHPGAVYLHRAQTWLVEKFDLFSHEIVVKDFERKFFTRPMSNKNTEILEIVKKKTIFGCSVNFGRLKVRERVTGYQKRNSSTNKLIATMSLDLPEQTLETEGVWIDLPDFIKEEFEKEQLHFMGAIHALEHAMIAMFPLLVLCDRNDIGGISCPRHEQTDLATVFIYDGHQGGIGLAREAYRRFETLIKSTETTVKTCRCKNGCPSCVHSPRCGSGNRPIDKGACLILLEKISASCDSCQPEMLPTLPDAAPRSVKLAVGNGNKIKNNTAGLERCGPAVLPKRYGVFDVETKYSAAEVGGWHRADKMGISVAVVWDSQLDGCATYLESEADKFVEHLLALDLIIGFNNKRFDNRVISAYTETDLNKLPTVDILEEVYNHLGYRLSLDRLAETTLGVKKSADGLQALRWYHEGKIEEICKYCQKDVEITRDLFHYGLEEGFLLFTNKAGKKVRLPLNLEESVQRITGVKGRKKRH